jgi:hypothetical protein
LGRRELLKCPSYFERQTRSVLRGNFRHVICVQLRCGLAATPANMSTAHFSRNGKKPGFKRSFCIVGVSGLVDSDKHFLADILEFVALCQMSAQKARYQRTNFLK